MKGKAKILGHSIHPILIVFPLGLLSMSVIFDVIHLFSGNPVMTVASYWMLISGIVGGFIAAPFGFIDWLSIPQGTRARTIGMMHGLANVVGLVLFIMSFFLRQGAPQLLPTTAFVFSLLGLAFALVGDWLGGELVERLGVGVDEGAHVDAPSSLETATVSTSGTRHATAGR